MRNSNRTATKRREAGEDIVRPDTIIVSSGKYGTCDQYTRILMERLGADAIGYSKKTLGYTSLYKNIIWIGAIKDGEIRNINIFWQNYNNFGLDGKKIIACGVGLGDPDNKAYFDKVMARSSCNQGFSSNYILPGRVDRDRLNFLDKPQFEKFLVDSKRIYGEETAILINERVANEYNGVDFAALEPIIEEILETRQ